MWHENTNSFRVTCLSSYSPSSATHGWGMRCGKWVRIGKRTPCAPCRVGGLLGMMSLSGVVTTGEVPLVVEQLVATAPAASGDNSTDTSGRVTISRRRVESMLVDAYREKLSGMTDAELSRLFESEVLREFPSASILGGGEAGGEVVGKAGGEVVGKAGGDKTREGSSGDSSVRAGVANGGVGGSSSGGLSVGTAAETAPEMETRAEVTVGLRASERLGGEAAAGGVMEALVARVFGDVRDPKEVAVPIMGAGALVLGVALMYKLISTLSMGGGQGRAGAGEGGEVRVGEGLPPPAVDPYTRYDSVGSGEVIWQRQDGIARERGGTTGAMEGRGQVRATEVDPWRAPLPGAAAGLGGDAGARIDEGGDEVLADRGGADDNLPTAKDVLDNAEDLV